jgi:hypothetical protein
MLPDQLSAMRGINVTSATARQKYHQITDELKTATDIIRSYGAAGDTLFSLSVKLAPAEARNRYYELVAITARWEQLIIENGWGSRDTSGDLIWNDNR